MKFIMISENRILENVYNETFVFHEFFLDFINYDFSKMNFKEEIFNTFFFNFEEVVPNYYVRASIFRNLIYGSFANKLSEKEIKKCDLDDSDTFIMIYPIVLDLIWFQKRCKSIIEGRFSYNLFLEDMVNEPTISYGFKMYKQTPYEEYEINDIISYCIFSIFKLYKSRKSIKFCQNCQDYFIPLNRQDEIYCSKIHENGRTCKDMGYENKIKDDEALKEYRRIYKNKNAFKNRQKTVDLNAEANFRRWAHNAKISREAYIAGHISKRLFLSCLNDR